MDRILKISAAAMSALMFAGSAAVAAGQGEMKVVWDKDYISLSAQFRGKKVEYPAAIAGQSKAFPKPGERPRIDVRSDWPTFTMVVRWSATTKGWPAEHRDSALDYVLMSSCDAALMQKLFPEMISEGRLTAPLQFRKEAASAKQFSLVEALRGQVVKYEVVTRAGPGASDYEIRTKVRVGLSKDGKTIFTYDSPGHISKHLKVREILFAAHDAGDRILFQIHVVCICTPRRLFQDVAMKRVEDTNRYFVDKLYSVTSDAPTSKELEQYFELLKEQSPDLRLLMERHKAEKRKAASRPASGSVSATPVTAKLQSSAPTKSPSACGLTP